jgi:cell division ATPase FtsA
LQTKGHTISFPKKRKISRQDVDALFDSGLNELLSKNQCIRHSAMYYALGVNRKYFDEEELYGVPSTILKGALCYYFVAEKFSAIAGAVLKDLGFAPPKYLPSTLAQAQYLLSAKRREGYAFLLDVGFLTSSVSVIYGNGIVRERTFDCGLGTVIVALMQAFEVDYSVAEEILESVNVSGGVVSRDIVWTSQSGEFTIPVHNINEVVKYALDVLCENVERFFGEYYREKNTMAIAVNPISITGEGIGSVSGLAEHIAKRLNRLTETVYPDLPYYDKPTFSSRMAVLNMALSDHKTSGWFYKLFGGKKK